MKSIIQDEKECIICGNPECFEHHCYYGSKNRSVSEKHGFKIYLCLRHHTDGPYAIHNNKETDAYWKKVCQEKFEENHSRSRFLELIGRNYLD